MTRVLGARAFLGGAGLFALRMLTLSTAAMTFSHINRRVHLISGLALLPWFLMYGVSSIQFAHNQFFEQRDRAKGLPQWTLQSEFGVERADCPGQSGGAARARRGAPPSGRHRQQRVRRVSAESDAGQRLLVPLVLEVDPVEVTSPTRRRSPLQIDRLRSGPLLHGRATRAEVSSRTASCNAQWSVVVDLVCIGIVLWIATGLYMWWGVPGSRRWGWGRRYWLEPPPSSCSPCSCSCLSEIDSCASAEHFPPGDVLCINLRLGKDQNESPGQGHSGGSHDTRGCELTAGVGDARSV